MVMVGINYKLKERNVREVPMGEREKSDQSVSFTEGRGAFSTLVSATTMYGKRNVDV